LAVNQEKLRVLAGTVDVEVGLLVPQGWWSLEWQRRFLLEVPDPRVRLFPARVWLEGRSGAYLYPPWAVWHAISRFQPDIIQVEEEAFALSTCEMALWSRFMRKPLVIFCWENVDRRLSLPRRWARRFSLSTASQVLAGGQGAARLVRTWGYRGRIGVIPQLGVNVDMFVPRATSRDETRFVIGYVGRLVHQKGVDLLIEAARRLLKRGHTIEVTVVGTGPDEAKLRSQVDALGLSPKVIWTGAVAHDRVPEALAGFDVLVLPSRSVSGWTEQFGHVLIEAMAMGVPVVGSSCGEIPSVIGRSDLVFPEGDAGALADTLQRLLLDPRHREEASRHGLARVMEHYTHERIAARTIAFWRSLLEPGATPPHGLDHERDERAVV